MEMRAKWMNEKARSNSVRQRKLIRFDLVGAKWIHGVCTVLSDVNIYVYTGITGAGVTSKHSVMILLRLCNNERAWLVEKLLIYTRTHRHRYRLFIWRMNQNENFTHSILQRRTTCSSKIYIYYIYRYFYTYIPKYMHVLYFTFAFNVRACCFPYIDTKRNTESENKRKKY